MNFFASELSKNDLVAAPMAGISSAPFRRLLRKWFSGLVYTEMVSVEGVSRNNDASMMYLDSLEGDAPVVVQLFGGKAESYPKAAEYAERYANPAALDVNMGCPVKKVIKSGGGCALLRDLDKLALIVRSLRGATTLPFSIKIRTAWEESHPVYMDILDIAEVEGADALTLHGRTRPQMFGGMVDYDAISQMAAKANIPIIGNGNVVDYDSYLRMKQTGVRGVMIGRGMMHMPWIFQAINEKRSPVNYYSPSELYDILMLLREYMHAHSENEDARRLHYFNILRKYSVWFSKNLPEAAAYRGEIFKDNDEERVMKLMREFYS